MNKSPKPADRYFHWSRIGTNALVRFLLFFASGWALVALLQYFEYAIFVFAFSAILALLLNYLMQFLQQFVGRSVALSLIIILSLIVIIVAVVAIGLTLSNQIQQLATLLLQTLNTANNPIVNVNGNAIENVNQIQQQVDSTGINKLMQITVSRNGDVQRLAVRPEALPAQLSNQG
jgi:predicted PurR-regulated permease PerM